ncbi:hypothetical protein BDZ89DRAFT_1137693 [Hymenopellis radicata]|nr:hypothetical protein BDZ89DRAFT_1137693 [Hymenopellis radicata]
MLKERQHRFHANTNATQYFTAMDNVPTPDSPISSQDVRIKEEEDELFDLDAGEPNTSSALAIYRDSGSPDSESSDVTHSREIQAIVDNILNLHHARWAAVDVDRVRRMNVVLGMMMTIITTLALTTLLLAYIVYVTVSKV